MAPRHREQGHGVNAGRVATWMTYMQVMDLLGVGRSTLDGWRKSGRIVFSKLPNGQLRIRRAELERWIEDLAEDWVPTS